MHLLISMSKKTIAKKVIYFFSNLFSKLPCPSLKPRHNCLSNIYANHDIYDNKTFDNFLSGEKYDLCLVIPFYNVPFEFAYKCLSSLLTQKTKYRYQIICVNDGSSDDTSKKIKKIIAGKESFVKLIEQPNGGISCARNTGIKYSNCEYIGFIDQDDWVEVNYVEKLLSKAYEYNFDIVKCSHFVFKDGQKIGEYALPNKDYLEGIGEHVFDYSGMIWSGIYKRDIFEKVRFPIGFWYEDMISRFLIYRLGSSFASLEEPLYFKRKHQTNASVVVWNKKSIKSLDHIYLVEHLMNESKKLDLFNSVMFKNVINELGCFLMWRIRGLPSKIQKAAFYRAASLAINNPFDTSLFNNLELEIYKSLSKKQYLKWKHLSWKQWAITKE